MDHELEVHDEPIFQISRELSMEIIMKFQLSTYALDGRVHEETPTKVLIPLDDMHVKTVISLAYLLQKFCEKIY